MASSLKSFRIQHGTTCISMVDKELKNRWQGMKNTFSLIARNGRCTRTGKISWGSNTRDLGLPLLPLSLPLPTQIQDILHICTRVSTRGQHMVVIRADEKISAQALKQNHLYCSQRLSLVVIGLYRVAC